MLAASNIVYLAGHMPSHRHPFVAAWPLAARCGHVQASAAQVTETILWLLNQGQGTMHWKAAP